jgi:hypothetical protein
LAPAVQVVVLEKVAQVVIHNFSINSPLLKLKEVVVAEAMIAVIVPEILVGQVVACLDIILVQVQPV